MGSTRTRRQLLAGLSLVQLLAVTHARLTIQDSSSNTSIGCFSYPPTFAFASLTTVLQSPDACRAKCLSLAAPVSALSSEACACSVELPDDDHAVVGECDAQCADEAAHLCSQDAFVYRFSWTNGTLPSADSDAVLGTGQTSARPSGSWLAAVIVPWLLLLLVLGLAFWQFRRMRRLIRQLKQRHRQHASPESSETAVMRRSKGSSTHGPSSTTSVDDEKVVIPCFPCQRERRKNGTREHERVSLLELADLERQKTTGGGGDDYDLAALPLDEYSAGEVSGGSSQSRWHDGKRYATPQDYRYEPPLAFGSTSADTSEEEHIGYLEGGSRAAKLGRKMSRRNSVTLGKHGQKVLSRRRTSKQGAEMTSESVASPGNSMIPPRARRKKGKHGTGEDDDGMSYPSDSSDSMTTSNAHGLNVFTNEPPPGFVHRHSDNSVPSSPEVRSLPAGAGLPASSSAPPAEVPSLSINPHASGISFRPSPLASTPLALSPDSPMSPNMTPTQRAAYTLTPAADRPPMPLAASYLNSPIESSDHSSRGGMFSAFRRLSSGALAAANSSSNGSSSLSEIHRLSAGSDQLVGASSPVGTFGQRAGEINDIAEERGSEADVDEEGPPTVPWTRPHIAWHERMDSSGSLPNQLTDQQRLRLTNPDVASMLTSATSDANSIRQPSEVGEGESSRQGVDGHTTPPSVCKKKNSGDSYTSGARTPRRSRPRERSASGDSKASKPRARSASSSATHRRKKGSHDEAPIAESPPEYASG